MRKGGTVRHAYASDEREPNVRLRLVSKSVMKNTVDVNNDFLLPLTKKRRKRPFIVLDLESKDGETQNAGFTRVFMVGAYTEKMVNGKLIQRYLCKKGPDCIDEMMRTLLTPKTFNYHFYAHNGGKFDFLHLMPWIVENGFELGYTFQITPISSSIQILDILPKNRHGRWRFLDSYKLVPLSLKKMAKTFGVIEKLEDHDLNLHEDEPAWEEYNKRDCEALYQSLIRFHHLVETGLQGEVGITTASTSMKTYRRVFQHTAIARSKETHEFIRQGYYGGRVEVFHKTCEDLHYYDINSCYPKVMCEPMPVGKALPWKGTPPDLLRNNHVGFAEVKVSVPEDILIPPLPYRIDGKLIFPVGEFSGVWDNSEILELEKMGGKVLSWGKSVWYPAIDLFSDMCITMFQFRDTSRPDYDEGLAYVAKILLNALYGKFGMKTLRTKLYPIGEDLPQGAQPVVPGDIESYMWFVKEEVDASYIIPQIAAHVTALSRVLLLRYVKESLTRGGKVAYIDTDSILTTSNLQDLCGTGLGQLKDEGKGSTFYGEFLQPKLYMLIPSDGGKPKVVMKGYSSRDFETFEHVKGGGEFQGRNLEKIGSLARRGFRSGPQLLETKKMIRSHDTKRLFLKDGSSKPVRIAI